MLKRFIVCTALLCGLAAFTFASDENQNACKGDPGKWQPLFNGKDLTGWKHVGPGSDTVEDGLIHTHGGMGLLYWTKEKFGNCRIKVVYKMRDHNDNSGVFIRIADKPKDEWYAVHHGYEVQISDGSDPFHRTGAIYSLSQATASPAQAGEWNTMEITLDGERVTVAINGVQVQDFDPTTATIPERTKPYEPERGPRPSAGYLGLQNHDDVGHGKPVYFKEVSVRQLEK